jgi:hypothetical protein
MKNKFCLLMLILAVIGLTGCVAASDRFPDSNLNSITLIDNFPLVSTPSQSLLGNLNVRQISYGSQIKIEIKVQLLKFHELVHLAVGLPSDCFYPVENNIPYIPEISWLHTSGPLSAQFSFEKVSNCKDSRGTLDYQLSAGHDGLDDHTVLNLVLQN